jgi:hypothetical protein
MGWPNLEIAQEEEALDRAEVPLGLLVKGTEGPHSGNRPSEPIESGRDVASMVSNARAMACSQQHDGQCRGSLRFVVSAHR